MAKAAVVREPTLVERIEALEAEIEELIERETERNKQPGVPGPVIRGLILARAHGGLCRCRWAKALCEKDGAQ